MESGSEDEDNVVQVRAALKTKQQELKQMQDEFDEYTQSSHELEQELEQELSRVEKRNSHLLSKNQYLERDLHLARGKLEEALDQTRKFEDELQATRAELQAAVQAQRKLEQQQDELETQVRVLQATESDLRHKMEREMEEKVFLLSDQEELQREHELATERFRTEIMDLKSELFALQQKFEDATAASETFSGDDSMPTTRSQSEEDDDGYDSSYNENSLRHSTAHERDEISREVLIESLREEIEALSSSVQDETEARAAAEADVQQLREALAHMEAMEAEMTDMTDELIGKSQEIRTRDEQIEELRESLLKLQSEMATVNDGGIEFTNERENMRSELEDKEKQSNNLKEELESVKAQCDDLAESERQLKSRLEQESDNADELKEQIDTLTRKLEESKKERSQLESKLQFDKGEISQNRKEVEDLNTINLDLQKQLDEATKRTSELERASALSTASTVSSISEKDAAESKRLMMEIQTMRTSLNSLSAENDRLRNQEGISSSVVPAKRVSADVLQVNFTPEQLARKYLAERTRNASLLSRLQTVCGNIQVFCRVRPIINEELEKSWGSKLAVNVVNQSDLAAMDIRPDRLFSSNSNGSNGNMDALANNSSWKVNQIVKNKKDILSAKKAFAELQSLKQQMQISKRKYTQSQQSVVALKRDQKNQSEKQSATLQNRLKSWETQNESLKTQNESLKRLVDDMSSQLKVERETKQKEAEQREAAQRLLRQQSAKTRVSSSQQEAQQKLLHEREEEIKKLRQLLTEARRRSTSSLIPRLPLSSPPMKKTKSSRPAGSAGDNQQENDGATASGGSSLGASRIAKTRTVARRPKSGQQQTSEFIGVNKIVIGSDSQQV
ncbi:Nuclear distribution protein nudE-like protein 1 [Phytophthora ramorum]|uniref:Nuclear distribution protein nudE-like protein 1 n=1 Tax=Phytophthora ramorum TaxID=164328 RepID=UPI00309AC9D1|nr:Nuclear distribution protein nudE-like protein 1 [Phytophthora ramorum]